MGRPDQQRCPSLTRYAQVSAGVSHENSFLPREIEEMNARIASLQVPLEKPVLSIRALENPLIAVHVQSGSTLPGCIGQAIDIKVLCTPGITIDL